MKIFRNNSSRTSRPALLRVGTAVCLSLLVCGCPKREPRPGDTGQALAPAPSATPTPAKPAEVAPAPLATTGGRITYVNAEYHFIVVDFAAHTMPAIGARLNVLRGEKRVGAVQITEPVRARFATADIVEGDAQLGDEVR